LEILTEGRDENAYVQGGASCIDLRCRAWRRRKLVQTRAAWQYFNNLPIVWTL